MSGTFIDLENWPRRPHFEFFRSYDNPYFNVTVDVDVTRTRTWCGEHGRSFFLATLHAATAAANAIEAFRMRLRPDGVWCHDVIHAGCTVLKEDETFGFGYFDYGTSFRTFEAAGRKQIEAVREGPDHLDDRDRDDLIYLSVLPWITFTSFQHARRWNTEESIPRLVFGKRHEVGQRALMPVSVEVHHSLADGLHVGRFIDAFQARLLRPAEHLIT